jgi:hypothetical protein
LSSLKKTRPETTAGSPKTCFAPASPKAHFNLRCGTWAAVRCAALAGWKRELERSRPQPFQAGLDAGSAKAGFASQRLDTAVCAARGTKAATNRIAGSVKNECEKGTYEIVYH